MTSHELSEIQELLPALTALSTSSTATATVPLVTLQQVLNRWPLSHRFPLLDIYRLACSGPTQGPIAPASFALQTAQWSAPWPSGAEEAKTRGTLSLLALRAVSNVLSTASSTPIDQVSATVQWCATLCASSLIFLFGFVLRIRSFVIYSKATTLQYWVNQPGSPMHPCCSSESICSGCIRMV
jgi:hypothetical protein